MRTLWPDTTTDTSAQQPRPRRRWLNTQIIARLLWPQSTTLIQRFCVHVPNGESGMRTARLIVSTSMRLNGLPDWVSGSSGWRGHALLICVHPFILLEQTHTHSTQRTTTNVYIMNFKCKTTENPGKVYCRHGCWNLVENDQFICVGTVVLLSHFLCVCLY